MKQATAPRGAQARAGRKQLRGDEGVVSFHEVCAALDFHKTSPHSGSQLHRHKAFPRCLGH